MAGETWTFEELFEGRDAAPSFVAELERLGLLRVVAWDMQGGPLYGPEAKQQLEKVLSLVELGYQPKDIAAIAHRVGLPAERKRRRRLFRRQPTYMRVTELANKSGIDEDVLRSWLDAGILEPVATTEGGAAMFSLRAVETVTSLQDLVEFGCNDEQLRAWSVFSRDLDALYAALSEREGKSKGPLQDEDGAVAACAAEGDAAGHLIRRRLDRLREGIRRWHKLLNVHEKRLERVRRAYDLDAPRARRRKRRRVRTRRPLPDEGKGEQ